MLDEDNLVRIGVNSKNYSVSNFIFASESNKQRI